MIIRKYKDKDEKSWVYCKALSYLFSPFFDDREQYKTPLLNEVYEKRIELVAEENGQIIGLLDIDIYNEKYSKDNLYAPCKKLAYFTNLAVHPDYQNRKIAQNLYKKAMEALKKDGVEKLVIFTRQGNVANHLYKKWGGQLVCQSYLVVGTPKDNPEFYFGVDLSHKVLDLKNKNLEFISYYQSSGTYIVKDKESLDLFDIEALYEEYTYVVDV